MDHDESLAGLAADQYGVVSRQQALRAGIPEHVVRKRVSRGRLQVLHPGVYAVPGRPRSFRGDLLAACLAAGEHAAASHRAAAHLWQLGETTERLELSVARPADPRVRGVRIHRVARLERVDVTRRDGIPLTKPARTLVDLAQVVSEQALELAVDDALTRGLVTCRSLAGRLEALGRPGRKGVRALQAVLDARPDGRFRVQSRFEQRLLRVLAQNGITGAVPQYEVRLPGGRRARVDVAFPAVKLAIEADSYAHHASRRGWARDHTRNAALVAAGWRVLPVTWDDLNGRPDAVAAVVAAALAVGRAAG